MRPRGIRDTAGGVLDPYRACLGLAAAAADRGATIFERSPVRKIKFGRRKADVITAAGSIRADRVVIATGLPTPLFKSLVRHFWFRTTYLAMTERVPARIRQQLGGRAAVVRDLAEPWHLVRWVDEERLVVAGADMPSPPAVQRDKLAVQRTGQLMYELSTLYPDISGMLPEYGWDDAVRAHLRWTALHRTPPELPASSLCLRRFEPRRGRGLSREPHAAAPSSRTSSSRPTAHLASRAMAVDLLVFGPHPDDSKSALGGIVARHAALGFSVGLCDLTAGEMGSNGTVEERLKESEAACTVLGAAWRENLRWPDRRIGKDPAHLDEAVGIHSPASPARGRGAVLGRSAPRPWGCQRSCSPRRCSTAGCASIRPTGSRGRSSGCATTSSTTASPPSFVVDVTDYYARKRQALDCHSSQFRPGPNAVGTRLNTPLFRQLVESRDAQFGAQAGVAWAEGIVVPGAAAAADASDEK